MVAHLIPNYVKQATEWQAISDELLAKGLAPVAADVTNEQKKRMEARGEKYMEYDDIVSEYVKNGGTGAP